MIMYSYNEEDLQAMDGACRSRRYRATHQRYCRRCISERGRVAACLYSDGDVLGYR